MASSTKLVCFFFLLTTLQIHARDSQFFSKVSRNRGYATNYPNNNYYNNQDSDDVTTLPFSKQQHEVEQEQPSYTIPQTTQGSFGLYGHDTGLDPPTSTSTSTNTRTKPTTLYNMDDNSFENPKFYKSYEKYENYESNHKENSYEPKLEGLSEASYTNNNDIVVPWKYASQNNYNNNNNNDNNNNNRGEEGNYNGGVEKQGMSDTRYLENGKYFYDISLEKNLNNDFSYNNNNFENNYNNYLKNNNNGKFYGGNNNNNNNYYNGNGMQQGYNSQFSENEFDFDDQP